MTWAGRSILLALVNSLIARYNSIRRPHSCLSFPLTLLISVGFVVADLVIYFHLSEEENDLDILHWNSFAFAIFQVGVLCLSSFIFTDEKNDKFNFIAKLLEMQML